MSTFNEPSEHRAKQAVYMIAYGATDGAIAKELRTTLDQVKEWRALLSRADSEMHVKEMIASLRTAIDEAGGVPPDPDVFTKMTVSELIDRYASNGIRFTYVERRDRCGRTTG